MPYGEFQTMLYGKFQLRLTLAGLGGLLLFCSMTYGDHVLLQEDFTSGKENQLPARWGHRHFRGPTLVTLEALLIREEGNPVACLRSDKDGTTLDTLCTRFSGIEQIERKLRLSFRYKTASESMPLFVSISADPGCVAPAVKKFPELIRDGRWHLHEVVFDVNGFQRENPIYDVFGYKRDGLMVEFIVEGRIKSGDQLLIDDVMLKQAELPALAANLFSPGGCDIFEKTTNQEVIMDLICRQKPTNFHIDVFRGGQTDPLFSKDYLVADARRVSVDLSEQPVGSYRIDVKADEARQLASWRIDKRPHRDHSVLIRDGVPYVNGEPFLTIGLFHASDPVIDIINKENAQGVADGRLTREEMFQGIKNRGFNTVHHSWRIGSKSFYEEAARHGLMVISEQSGGLAAVEDARAEILAVKDQPNAFGWYGIDEPSTAAAEHCEQLYRYYKQYDPYHPVMSALHDGAYGFEGLRFIDIACPDFYPIRDSTSDVTGTALYAMDCREVLFGSDPTTCVIAIPQLFAFGGPWGPGVEPTYRQVRAEVYAAIVGGAKGVWYYAYYTSGGMKAGMPLNPKRNHWFLPESNLWASIGELNSELQGFKEVILFGKPCSKVTVISKSGVLFRAISLHDKTYLFIVNPASEARSNLRVRMPAAWDKATPLCGSPALRKQGRSWRFDLSGYEVGIYRIGSSAD